MVYFTVSALHFISGILKGLATISIEVIELADKAKKGKLQPHEFQVFTSMIIVRVLFLNLSLDWLPHHVQYIPIQLLMVTFVLRFSPVHNHEDVHTLLSLTDILNMESLVDLFLQCYFS